MEEIKRISFSELKNWKECPYRHRLIHVDKIPYFEGNEFTAFGTAIHKTCELIVPKNNVKNPEKIFTEEFEKEINLLKKTSDNLNEDLLREMKDQGITLSTQILPALNESFNEFEVVSIEEQILQPITEFESYGKNFKGFIDLVIKTKDNKFHIIDWKSCSWGWSSHKKSDALTSYQLTYYKNYFSKKHNIPLGQIETYFALLKRTAKKENVEIFRVTSGSKKIDNSLKLLQNAVINIEKGTKIKNRLNCKFCKFKNTEHCT